MSGVHEGQFQAEIERVCSFFWVVIFLFSLIPISLTLWWLWNHHSNLVESALQICLCSAFVWVGISMNQFFRTARQLGLSSEARMRLLSGTRPIDPDERRVWQWFLQFLLAVLAILLFMFALPFVSR
jgi:hypothetical protein